MFRKFGRRKLFSIRDQLNGNVTLLGIITRLCTHRPVPDVEHAAVEDGLGPGDHGHVAGVLGVEVGAAGRGLGEGAAVKDHLVHGVDPDPRLRPIPDPRLCLVLSLGKHEFNLV